MSFGIKIFGKLPWNWSCFSKCPETRSLMFQIKTITHFSCHRNCKSKAQTSKQEVLFFYSYSETNRLFSYFSRVNLFLRSQLLFLNNRDEGSSQCDMVFIIIFKFDLTKVWIPCMLIKVRKLESYTLVIKPRQFTKSNFRLL